ncbi:cupin domain-containing protein [Pseudomonas siliginis]|uniref:JmjC domain-containing protein n=1 Tax=Pseudomonas siliginis TaxID=2842346 RepID=UPI002B2508F1|nr:cupin domain-containing protein [Pseudomonas siliginis]MEB2651455.1 cupin domain-containing protein [Pseudomonas siliginis]
MIEIKGCNDYALGQLERYWEEQPARIIPREGGRFDFFDSFEFFKILNSKEMKFPMVRLYQDGVPIDEGEYTFTRRYGGEEFPLTVDPNKVGVFISEGATTIIQSIEQHSSSVAGLCRVYEESLFCPVQANAFYTPCEKQSVAAHYDSSDVFVLQIDGSKDWRLWDFFEKRSNGKRPYNQQVIDDLTRKTPPKFTFRLNPGEILYLPRGLIHQAQTTENDSLHISMIAHPTTWKLSVSKAIEQIADSLEADLKFRSTVLVSGSIVGSKSKFSESSGVNEVVDKIVDSITWDQLKVSAVRRVIKSSFPSREGRLLDIIKNRTLSRDSFIQWREQQPFEIEARDSEVVIHLTDRALILPKVSFVAIQGLKNGEPVRVKSIRGLLTIDGKISLAQALVKNGICTVLDFRHEQV